MEEDRYARDAVLRLDQLPPSKKYFNYRTLEDIIAHFTFKPGLRPDQIEQERQNRYHPRSLPAGAFRLCALSIVWSDRRPRRRALAHFLRGMLNLDPDERWTPEQAQKHPFITGQPFTGHWAPPPRLPPPLHIPAQVFSFFFLFSYCARPCRLRLKLPRCRPQKRPRAPRCRRQYRSPQSQFPSRAANGLQPLPRSLPPLRTRRRVASRRLPRGPRSRSPRPVTRPRCLSLDPRPRSVTRTSGWATIPQGSLTTCPVILPIIPLVCRCQVPSPPPHVPLPYGHAGELTEFAAAPEQGRHRSRSFTSYDTSLPYSGWIPPPLPLAPTLPTSAAASAAVVPPAKTSPTSRRHSSSASNLPPANTSAFPPHLLVSCSASCRKDSPPQQHMSTPTPGSSPSSRSKVIPAADIPSFLCSLSLSLSLGTQRHSVTFGSAGDRRQQRRSWTQAQSQVASQPPVEAASWDPLNPVFDDAQPVGSPPKAQHHHYHQPPSVPPHQQQQQQHGHGKKAHGDVQSLASGMQAMSLGGGGGGRARPKESWSASYSPFSTSLPPLDVASPPRDSALMSRVSIHSPPSSSAAAASASIFGFSPHQPSRHPPPSDQSPKPPHPASRDSLDFSASPSKAHHK